MKTRILFLLFFVANYSFSQSINDYKAVIIPLKYEFLKTENQYCLQTLTKFNLQKAGFISFYNNQSTPSDFNDRCSLLYIEVKNESTFLTTKLQITFKDCNDNIVFQSVIGKSKKKEYEKAYVEALNEAFKSVYDLQYRYSAKVEVPVVDSNKESKEIKIKETNSSSLLYAQPTPYGYQLIDSEPKFIIKLYKTSNPSSFIAFKGSIQGVLVSAENQWLFEYYQNNEKISENVEVKF